MLTAVGFPVPILMLPGLGDLLVQAVVSMLMAVLGQQKAEHRCPIGTTLRMTTVVAVLPGTGTRTGAGTMAGGRISTGPGWARRMELTLGILQEQQAPRGMAGRSGVVLVNKRKPVQGVATFLDRVLQERQTLASVVARRVLAAKGLDTGSLR